MAIKDMKGTVTTTGMMNNKPAPMKAPDMSKIKMPTERKQTVQKPVQQPVKQPAPQESGLAEKIQSLTNEDKATLSVVLSPSVSKVIAKLAPDVEPLLARFTKEEENIVLPVSIVKSFAAKRYGGQNETESVGNFIADLQQSVPNMVDQQSVPPDTQMANQPDNMVSPEMDTVDSGLLA